MMNPILTRNELLTIEASLKEGRRWSKLDNVKHFNRTNLSMVDLDTLITKVGRMIDEIR